MTAVLQLVLSPRVLAIGLALGSFTWWLARRGRRVDDHPLCRCCGFDLVGLRLSTRPPDAPGPGRPAAFAATSTDSTVACPECGAELARPRAVRTGHRRALRPLAAVGLALMLAAAAGWGWTGCRAVRAYDWNRTKPVWWILHELPGGPGPASGPIGVLSAKADALMDELVRRARAEKLTPGHYRRIVPLVRDRQRDLSSTWDWRWGELVELGYEQQRIGDAAFGTYLDHVVAGELRVRKRARAGAALPAEMRFQLRGGPGLSFEGVLAQFLIDGRPALSRASSGFLPASPRATGTAGGGRAWSYNKLLGQPFHRDLGVARVELFEFTARREHAFQLEAPPQPGTHELTATWTLHARAGLSPAPPSRVAAAVYAHEFKLVRAVSFQVGDPDVPTARFMAAPSLAAFMRGAFSVRRSPGQVLGGQFVVLDPPAPYVFIVTAEYADRRVPLGVLAPIRDDPIDWRDTRQFLFTELVPPDAPIRYVLTPSLEAAELTVDLEEIWGEEIVIEDDPAAWIGLARERCRLQPVILEQVGPGAVVERCLHRSVTLLHDQGARFQPVIWSGTGFQPVFRHPRRRLRPGHVIGVVLGPKATTPEARGLGR